MVAAAKAEITEITVADAKGLLDQGGYLFIDVREPNETAMGTIPGAVAIPRGLLEFRIAGEAPDKNGKIVVYCKSGGRSALATQTLGKMGYTAAVSMNGGWGAWEEAGYPIE
jgi:rhodanese-related sulfurtransferase